MVAAFRVFEDGEAADRADEYVRISRSTIYLSVQSLVRCIVSKWESTYLRRPSDEELKIMMDRNAERGFPGCVGSLDCSHWASSAAVPTCIWMSFAASHRISSAVHDIRTALDVL